MKIICIIVEGWTNVEHYQYIALKYINPVHILTELSRFSISDIACKFAAVSRLLNLFCFFIGQRLNLRFHKPEKVMSDVKLSSLL